ncbi:MAG: hypothetical protein AB1601_08340 [Planctomycetota bacterium]
MKRRAWKRCRRSAVLLEVVIALTVLVAAMGLLGAQLAGGLEMTAFSEEQLRAALLAEHLVALVRLDPRLAALMKENETLEYACTDETPLGYALAPLPGTFWRIVHEPVNREDQETLRRVVIEILRQPDQDRLDSSEGAEVVRQLVMLKAAPPKVDLVEQGGMTEAAAEILRGLVPIPGFDPRAVDFQQLMTMLDEDTLAQLMPYMDTVLGQLGGGGVPAQWAQYADQFGVGGRGDGGAGPGGANTDANALADMIRQAVEAAGGMPPPGPPPGPFRPGGGRPPAPPPNEGEPSPGPPPGFDVGQGSGPNGEYTIEDLMRLRDAYERQQGGGR